MIDQPKTRNRSLFDATAAAIAIACLMMGCGGSLMPDFLSDEPSASAGAADARSSETGESATATDARQVPRYIAAAKYSARHGGRALVVVEGSDVVFARGQNGHPLDEAHPIYNASLSFWGPLAVAAERDGLLDLDERVSATIEEFKGVRWKEDMRVRQLLAYTSGLESGFRPLINEKPENHFERALSLAMVAPPGERFQFGPSHLAVFGELLRRKLAPRSLDPLAYLQQLLLDPIGMKISDWERDAAGNINLSGGAKLTAQEWAKYGILIRNRGVWNGETVVKASSLEVCFRGSQAKPRFGLTFWLNGAQADAADDTDASEDEERLFPEQLENAVMAAGIGNQRLFAIPSLDLVVARMGQRDPSWRDREFLELLIAARQRR